MTLSELIDQLQNLQFELGENVDPVVRVAYQQSWPLEGSVANVTLLPSTDVDRDAFAEAQELVARGDEEADGFAEAQALLEDNPEELWLAVGDRSYGGSGYAPRGAWE